MSNKRNIFIVITAAHLIIYYMFKKRMLLFSPVKLQLQSQTQCESFESFSNRLSWYLRRFLPDT